MVGMPVYIRITATEMGNYTMEILISVDGQEDPVQLYIGELFLLSGIEVAVDISDFLKTVITAKTPFAVNIKHINEDIQEYANSEELYAYPGACENELVAQQKIDFNKSVPQNWLLTARTINNEVFIPETELTDDVFSKRHVLTTIEPGEFILIKDETGATIHTIMDNTPISLVQLRQDLFLEQDILHNIFHFCYEYYSVLTKKTYQKHDFSVYITQSQITDELYFIDFVNQFGVKERLQLFSLSYLPSYDERSEYMRYNPTKAKLMPKYERLMRTDSLTGSLGVCHGERLSFIMEMLQASDHTLVTPTGEYAVTVTPESSTLEDSKRTEYPITISIDFSEQSEFAIFNSKNSNSRIFTSPFGAQFQ